MKGIQPPLDELTDDEIRDLSVFDETYDEAVRRRYAEWRRDQGLDGARALVYAVAGGCALLVIVWIGLVLWMAQP